MWTRRVVHNDAARAHDLPPNPVTGAVRINREQKRDDAVPPLDMPEMWRRLDSVDCPIMRRAWLTLLLNHASTDVTFGYVKRAQLTGHRREAVEILAGRLLAYLDAKLERNVERGSEPAGVGRCGLGGADRLGVRDNGPLRP